MQSYSATVHNGFYRKYVGIQANKGWQIHSLFLAKIWIKVLKNVQSLEDLTTQFVVDY